MRSPEYKGTGERKPSAVAREVFARAKQRAKQTMRSPQIDGQVAEWLMAADCKSAGPRTYGGSNPPLSTRLSLRRSSEALRKWVSKD